ncbi:MAG: tyrosine-type recombinase/integrase [Peptostreptococcaceae bacterium]
MSFAFIRKRSKNYIVYLEYKDKETGKKIQKNMGSYDKKRDASKKLTELKDTIYNDELIVPNTVSVRNFLADFLEKHKINLSITTYNCYKRICDKYIIPMLGSYKVEEIKPIHIQNYVDDLVDILSPQTIKIHINILNLAFKKAYRLRMIRENVVEYIEIPRAKKFKNNIYNTESMVQLLKICKGSNLELPIYLASGLGLRISEILGLTWNNINFNENTITIEKITVRSNAKVILKEPKTESSSRTISAPKEIINLLKDHKKKQIESKLKGEIKNNLNLIFFDKKENPIAQDVLSKNFNRFLKENSLSHIRFHDLRHSHVTLLINSKVPIRVISERVGHSNINTTLNIYAHTLKEMDIEASDKISESLFKLS